MNGIEMLENRIKQIRAGKILDIASGNGNFVYFIKEFRSNDGIFCIDSNEELSPVYDKQFPDDNIKFIPMDANELDFADDTFDTVSISNSIHHLLNPYNVFDEMKRVVKNNGMILINEMFSDKQESPRNTHTMLHNWWGKVDTRIGVYHRQVYKRNELKEIIKRGFNDPEMEIIEYYQPFEEPFAENVLKQMDSYIDMYIEKIKKANLSEELITEGEEIRKVLYNNGYSPSGSLFYIINLRI